MTVLDTLLFVLRHPLTRHGRFAAFVRWLRWQFGTRLLPGPVVVPFVNETRLIVTSGMTGATGNVYCGLHEFEEMALVLHALRPDDVLVDVGANVGSYTLLGAVAGARCISIEPIPATFAWLQENIAINAFTEQIRALNVGLGRAEGTLRFTGDLDTTNRVVRDSEKLTNVIELPSSTLDAVLGDVAPTLIKLDVEGFETEVVAGAKRALVSPRLLALIMELNGSGRRYGFDEEALHSRMLALGFETCRYFPFERRLASIAGARRRGGNTLYVRDLPTLADRVATAGRFQLGIGAEI